MRVIESVLEATKAALQHLAAADFEPVVANVEDAGTHWRVFYNAAGDILAGNLPLLVEKSTGLVIVDHSFLPRWKAAVEVRLVGTSDGGRGRPVSSGYRPAWRSARKPSWNDAALQLDGIDSLAPGAKARGWVLPGVPTSWAGQIVRGDVLEGAEGSRIVAIATVVEVTLWHANDHAR